MILWEKYGGRGKKSVAVGKFIPGKLLLHSWMGFGARKERNLLETTVVEIQNRRASNRPRDPRLTDDKG